MSARDFAQASPLASAGAFAGGGGGGHSQAFELLAGFLTQFSPRTRNNFIAILAVLVLVLTLPAQAQTTVTISAPSTLHEGGLVAQQVGNCPEKQMERPTKQGDETVSAFYTRYIAWMQANDYNRNYCEFRDIPDDAARKQTVTITIRNADAGEYLVLTEGLFVKLLDENGNTLNDSQVDTLQQGDTKTLTYDIVSKNPNYTPGDTITSSITVWPPGFTSRADIIATHTITIVDDDNTAYIGRRRHHPYGETWNSQPHCYSHGCAWD